MSDEGKTDLGGATLFRYADIDWDNPLKTAAPGTKPPEELVRAAQSTGARRKKVTVGQGGFFTNRSVLPAGFEIPPHTHDHAELLIVLRGGCEVIGSDPLVRLGADDAIVVEAGHEYGFLCGDEGMEFLTIRTAEAGIKLSA
jgi:quercetin dioxygenase-like cupin family protein